MNDSFEIHEGLQATLMFSLPKVTMFLDRSIMSENVRSLIAPAAMKGVLNGNVVFKQIPFVEKDRHYAVIDSGHVDLEIYWQAHKPWWPADNGK